MLADPRPPQTNAEELLLAVGEKLDQVAEEIRGLRDDLAKRVPAPSVGELREPAKKAAAKKAG